jgi:hypothetical protein
MYIPDIWLADRAIQKKFLGEMDPMPQQVFPVYGNLLVRVTEARGLPSASSLHANNPFAVISYAGAHNQTEPILGSSKPYWNALFTFNVFELRRELSIDIYDFQKLREAEGNFSKLGSATFSVAEELDGNRRTDSWITLWEYNAKSDAPKQCGAVRVALEYRPLWGKKGRISHIDAGSGWPIATPQEYAVLEIKVAKAEGLRPMASRPSADAGEHDDKFSAVGSESPDRLEVSNPYVVIKVLDKVGAIKAEFRSKPVKATLTPEWSDGSSNFHLYVSDSKMTARIDLYHKGRRGKEEHLGGLVLPLVLMLQHGAQWHTASAAEEHWFRLESWEALDKPRGQQPLAFPVDGELQRQYSCPLGAIQLTKFYGLELGEPGVEFGLGRLRVQILKGAGLPTSHFKPRKKTDNKGPDSFAIVSYDTKQLETNVVHNTRKPDFNRAIFEFSVTDVRTSFNVSLYEHSMLGDHHLIGSISIGSSIGPRLRTLPPPVNAAAR